MMPEVFAVDESGKVRRMEEASGEVQEGELQSLMEMNPELLPEDAPSKPEKPQWFLLKKYPGNGQGPEPGRADFVFVDRKGIPTLVLCKRLSESRDRQEMAGQLLEYAAAASLRWSETVVRDCVENGALEQFLGKAEKPDDFYQRVAENFQSGSLRLVFCVEQCPAEFRSVVDFLNRQMNGIHVFVVEAQLLRSNGMRLLVPTVFGGKPQIGEPSPIDDQADVDSEPSDETPFLESFDVVPERFDPLLEQFDAAPEQESWNEDTFFQEVSTQTTEDQSKAIRTLQQATKKLNYHLEWGPSREFASFRISSAKTPGNPIMMVEADGTLSLHFASLNGENLPDSLQQKYRSIAGDRLELPFPQEEEIAKIAPEDWCKKGSAVIRILDDLSTLLV